MRFLLLFLISFHVFSQDEQYSKLAIVQSPGSYDDGFSFGIQYEHQNETVYYGGEFYTFPHLNDITYNHLIGRFGFNKDFGWINPSWRLYLGGRAGVILRQENVHAMLGAEAGIDFFIGDMFIGLAAVIDSKTDSKIWGEDNHTVKSGYVRLGFKF